MQPGKLVLSERKGPSGVSLTWIVLPDTGVTTAAAGWRWARGDGACGASARPNVEDLPLALVPDSLWVVALVPDD
eukprot:SAG11_NODE_16165_length_555_cov_1.263158_1_plen_74_part_01